MKSFIIIQLTAISLLAHAETINFDDSKPGSLPAGWASAMTGKGTPKWSVEKDDTAPTKPNALKQSGEATYPLALKENSKLKDGFVEVQFKAIAGEEDQAGGIVWRAQDS